MMASRIVIVLVFILGISVPIQSQTTTPVDFGFSQSSFSGIEQGESYKVQVKFFSGGITTGFLYTISLDLSGTASSSDVSLVTPLERFLPGDVNETKDVKFSLTVDNIAQEINETFAIVLQLSSTDQFGGANVTLRDRLEVVIIDSDVITFQLSESSYTQNEEPNALMEVLITKGSGIQLANPVYFRVTPLTVDDALARGIISSEFERDNPENEYSPNRANYKDFDDSVVYVEFPTDRDAVEVAVPIVDDDIDEADEQIFIIFLEVVNATNLDNLNFLENREISVGRIKDDEIIRIGFERQSYEVIEPNLDEDGFVRNLVYLIREDNRKSEQTYSVDLTVGDPGGNAKPATIETSNTNQTFDYSFGVLGQTKQNVLFVPADDRIAFVFSLNPDLAVEGTETFRATSAQVTPSGDFPVFQTPTGVTAFANTLIHILDNDELEVGFEEEDYTVSESEGTVEVCVVVISPPPTDDLDVTVALSPSTIDGTAEAGSDFTQLTAFLSTILVFPSSPGSPTAGPRRECFNVTITDDGLFENTESFSLLLQEDTFTSQTGSIISPNLTEIFILDDDDLTFSFRASAYSFLENIGTVTVYVDKISGSTDVDITLRVSGFIPGGQALNQLITFTSLDSEKAITFNIPDDSIALEHPEKFTLTLTAITSGDGIMLQPNDKTDITILDEDELIIGFAGDISVSESENARLSITFSAAFATNFNINIGPSLNDSLLLLEIAEPNEDYFLPDFNVEAISTLHNASNSLYFDVSIIQDGFLEYEECFVTALSLSDSVRGSLMVEIAGGKETAHVCIKNDDKARFGFGPVQYTVSEGDGSITLFVVLLEGTLEREVNLQFSTVEGTAMASAPADYQTVTRTITFSSSVSNVSVPVTIFDDSILESTENFVGNLADPQSQTGVSIMPSIANVNITDNDGVTIKFERTTYLVDEGDVVEVCAVLSGTLKKSVEVSVSNSIGVSNSIRSATAVDDYNPVVAKLTFDQVTNRSCFNVTTVGDQILEDTENLNLDLSTLDRNVTLLPGLAQVSIRDNYRRVIFGLKNTSLTLNEEDGATARVCVIIITGTLEETVMFDLNTMNGTATSADFVEPLNSSNKAFKPRDSEVCWDISILDDTLYEEDESFSALLSTGDSSACINASRQSATIIIMDTDEITIGFTRERDMVEEDVDNDIITICVEIKNNGTLEKSITVQLDTVDGTAKANEDYNSTSHTLVFTPDNERDQQCRAVNILSDDNLEGTETFMATLFTRDDRVSLNPDTETIFIIDNDVVNILFIGGPFEGREESGFVAITVGIMDSEKLKTEVSVNLTTEDIVNISNAATAGVDYRPLDVTLTFSESVTVITVNITLLNDNTLEGDEDFKARLSTHSGSNVGLGMDAIITIVDDDNVTIGFEEETVQVDESIGMKTLCVNVSRGQLARNTIVSVSSQDQTAINGKEYSFQQITFTFSKDNTRQCFNVSILDDDINEPEKTFLVMLTTGDPQVTLSPDTATITIIDDEERRVAVNDTIIGDPLFTVPILVDRDQREMLNMMKPQLCYEIHGDADQWFNLVTDNCTTVNAWYADLNDGLNVNVIKKIGVKAVNDDNKCVEILVDREQCSVNVDGTNLGMERYSSGNINVRRYSKRARISVPNCNNINLIMWVICENRTVPSSNVPGYMLKFVVLRGLNYGRRAHGLLGQFWNVPVDITPYTGLLHDNTPATDHFKIKVKGIGSSSPRSFTGLLYNLSWDHVKEPCLYVGNRQAGPIQEVATPNDGVIKNMFQDYKVANSFSDDYKFSLFDLAKC